MTPEDEEFNRIEREADMRWKAVKAALKGHREHMAQYMTEYERGFIDGMQKQTQSSVDRALNRMADRAADAMDEVAHRFAHRLALDLECVLSKYDGPWYDQAWDTLSQYRSEMNKLHEQVSPTFMGEPLIKDAS
jgi:hypothetical protein